MGYKARESKKTGKRFMFLSNGFKKPSPEFMGEWGKWFESIADRIVDQGGLWGGGRELSKKGTKDLPLGKNSLTGFIIFTAKNLDEAEKIAKKCPVVLNNQVYEIMSK
jgi:hypothetical protein